MATDASLKSSAAERLPDVAPRRFFKKDKVVIVQSS
jgi:hypothetical protein